MSITQTIIDILKLKGIKFFNTNTTFKKENLTVLVLNENNEIVSYKLSDIINDINNQSDVITPNLMNLVGLGDSITYGIGSTSGNTSYLDIINSRMGFKTYTKLAQSGMRVMPGGGMPELYTQVQAIPAGTDVITIMAGVNDRNVSTLGNLTTVLGKTFASLDRTLSFTEAFRFNLETIKRNFPNAKIYVLTPIKTNWTSFPSLDTYVSREIAIANFLGIPVIDTNAGSGIFYGSPYLTDTTHLNDAGYTIVADYVENGIKNPKQARYIDVGIGTINTIAKWQADGIQGDSSITDNTNGVGLSNNITGAFQFGRNFSVSGQVNATANNDILSTVRIAGNFNNGAFTGVRNYGLNISGALNLQRFLDTAQQLNFDMTGINNIISSYSSTPAKELVFNSTTDLANTVLGAGVNGHNFQVRGVSKVKIYDDGKMAIQNGGTFVNNGVDQLQVTGSIKATGVIGLAGFTVGTLPTGRLGDTAYVTDALTPTYLSTAVGGGAVRCKVFFNGTNWIT